jgi:hypothetical protein
MKLRGKLRISLWLTLFWTAIAGSAATLWTGPTTNFVNNAGSDSTLAANQDRLTPNVYITRGSSQGIFNANSESSFTHFSSPAGTEWADGTTATYSSLTYHDWNTWAKLIHGGPRTTVGVNAVVHLISDDIYLDVQFTSWGGLGGGFSWQHSTPAAASNAPPTVSITSPTNGASFIAPANVTITADAQDSDGNVTNVVFFDGATPLGATNNQPYSIAANIAVGSHALTAVATDNGGLSTTSSIVNVTVSLNRLTIVPTGNTLDISWPLIGGRLQAQTNSFTSNWVTVANSTTTNRVVVPIDPANRSVFYRLSVP